MFADFDNLYETHLKKPLDELEYKRSKIVKPMQYFRWIGVGFVILFSLLQVFCGDSPITSVFVIVLLLGIIIPIGLMSARIANLKKYLRPRFKKIILLPILESLFDELEYLPQQKMAAPVLNKSYLFSEKIHSTKGDDFVRGKVGKTIVQFCEIEAYTFPYQKMNFTGLFLVASFNKYFSATTIVHAKNSTNPFRWFSPWYFSRMKQSQLVRLENPEFNKMFDVYSDNQIDARYILTPAMMERMIAYKKRSGKIVSFSFASQHLYMAIPIRTAMFEPRIMEPINDKEFIKSNFEQFRFLSEIVEELDLNTRIWTKV